MQFAAPAPQLISLLVPSLVAQTPLNAFPAPQLPSGQRLAVCTLGHAIRTYTGLGIARSPCISLAVQPRPHRYLRPRRRMGTHHLQPLKRAVGGDNVGSAPLVPYIYIHICICVRLNALLSGRRRHRPVTGSEQACFLDTDVGTSRAARYHVTICKARVMRAAHARHDVQAKRCLRSRT